MFPSVGVGFILLSAGIIYCVYVHLQVHVLLLLTVCLLAPPLRLALSMDRLGVTMKETINQEISNLKPYCE
jgi:cytochrome c oxidase subunit IV